MLAISHFTLLQGQVNSNLPWTFGDGIIHVSHLDALVYKVTSKIKQGQRCVLMPLVEITIFIVFVESMRDERKVRRTIRRTDKPS